MGLVASEGEIMSVFKSLEEEMLLTEAVRRNPIKVGDHVMDYLRMICEEAGLLEPEGKTERADDDERIPF